MPQYVLRLQAEGTAGCTVMLVASTKSKWLYSMSICINHFSFHTENRYSGLYPVKKFHYHKDFLLHNRTPPLPSHTSHVPSPIHSGTLGNRTDIEWMGGGARGKFQCTSKNLAFLALAEILCLMPPSFYDVKLIHVRIVANSLSSYEWSNLWHKVTWLINSLLRLIRM